MFTRFEFAQKFTEPVGLQPAKLERLKSIVVLAGPNGAGKSRYLRLVQRIVEAAQKAQENRIVSAVAGAFIPVILPEAERALQLKEAERVRQEAMIAPGLIRTTNGAIGDIRVISLGYTLDLDRDPHSQTSVEINKKVEANKEGGFIRALAGVNAYFHKMARAFADWENPRLRNKPVIQQACEDAEAFNTVLETLVSGRVDYAPNEVGDIIALFRGRPFEPSQLSAGELVLIGWAIVLHRQRKWLSNAHVLLDEPENHLHPDVCVRALDALQKILGPEGQIWLATHSVPLIAYAGIESVHFVDNGAIEYAGNQIEKVLDRLLGGQDGRAKLRALMADADDLAFESFAAQCLLPPGVASAHESDPQQVQMVKATKILGAGKENIRILDFAAGRGRLAAALRDAGQVANRRFTYYAFEDPRFSDPSDRRECLEHIQSLEQPGEPESYRLGTLEGLTVLDAERMDLAVMCNVLHEIPVGDWQHVFERIHDVLVDDGHLVILEDQTPSVGELPHADGYVILNEPALQHLFGSKDAVQRLSMEKDGRLTAFAVPRVFLKRVTPQTLGRALASVRRMAEERIRFIRDKHKDQRSFHDGRLHAHFALLYANALLTSRQFPEPDA
jgi:SAM-dependent methyltransferase/ABC-type ATPase involved in cell division